MRKEKEVYWSISLTVAVTGLILSTTYRPYIYGNNLNDFGFADTIGSLVAVIAAYFFLAGLKKYTPKEKNKLIIQLTLVYAVVWEMFGYYGIYGTFDWKDMIAAVISGAITYFLKERVDKRMKQKVQPA